MQVWVLRESFLAYERFHGVFPTKEEAVTAGPPGVWGPVTRTLPDYMWDEADPFESNKGAESIKVGDSLWVVEPMGW